MMTKLFASLAGTAALATTVAVSGVPGQLGETQSVAKASSSTGCPVTAKVLLKALRKSAAYKDGEIAPTSKLTDVDCSKRYAVAVTAPKEADALAVVFRYNADTETWKLIAFGSDGFCDAVPAKVRPDLELCA